MRKHKKSVLGAIALSAALMTAVCFSACTPGNYSVGQLDGYVSNAEVKSNGGFVVEKGDFVYFINAKENYWATNGFGVEKGSLMRIAKSDLEAGNYGEAQTVVPLLLTTQNYSSGIYIYGDYVYFATPTTDLNNSGVVQNTMLDFKCARLDGTSTMSGYFFRSTDNTGEYRFVEMGEGEDATVYCIYEESGVLKSFNTKTYEKKVLVKDAGDYYFDQTDPTNGKVYYTMSVTDKIDSDEANPFGYNQLYAVTPDASATTDGNAGSYTVSNAGGENYRTYSYDTTYLAGNLTGFNAWDYSTYPYVNLGQLVLDGIGKSEVRCKVTSYNVYNGCDEEKVETLKESVKEPLGYSYTLKSYQNGGVYFTRAKVQDGAAENKIYYLDDAAEKATTWTAIEGNDVGNFDVVAGDSSIDASNNALYNYDEVTGEHVYFYFKDSEVYKGGTAIDKDVRLLSNVSGSTLLYTHGDYLYYYTSGSTNLSRINYTGASTETYDFGKYEGEEYLPSTMLQVSFNTDWYKPEFVGDTLMYCNAQVINGTTYNYVYAMNVPNTAEKLNDEIEKYEDFLYYEVEADSTGSVIKNVMNYLFYGGDYAGFTDVEDLYSEYQVKEISDFYKGEGDYADLFKDKDGVSYASVSYFVNQVGAPSAADKTAMEAGLNKEFLTQRPAETVDDSFPVWAIVLICIGAALLVGAAIAIPCVYVYKKKQKQRAAIELTRVRKRKKIDTTDDKTIDVYGEDKAEESVAEETTTESAETPVEDGVVEEGADDSAQAPVEGETPTEESADGDDKAE